MAKMTKTVALNTALTFIPAEQTEVREVLTNMVAQLSKPRATSDEAKAKQAEKRKAATAAARADLVAKVAPVLRKYLTAPMTAKEVFEAAKAELPTDFSWNKVQNVLTREMRPELDIVETKGKANTYQVRG